MKKLASPQNVKTESLKYLSEISTLGKSADEFASEEKYFVLSITFAEITANPRSLEGPSY